MIHDESECPEFTVLIMGLAARQMLMEKGMVTPYDFYICYKRMRPRFKPLDAYRLFWIMKKLGLVMVVAKERGEKPGFLRSIYTIVPGMEDHPAWVNPPRAYYKERYR